jgi:hypothetical protein
MAAAHLRDDIGRGESLPAGHAQRLNEKFREFFTSFAIATG